jgi:Leucine-rich repeat (LRR) protein
MVKNIVKKILFLFQIIKVTFGSDTFTINTISYSLIGGPNFERTLYTSTAIITDNDTLAVLVSQQNLTGLNCKMLNIINEIDFLEIDDCNVDELKTKCFLEQIEKVLNYIKITNNNLGSIKNGTFKNLKLKSLQLVNNNIEALEDEAFVNLPNLETIDLKENKLRRLNPDAIIDTPSLNGLDLTYNLIEFLEKRSFTFIKTNCAIIHLRHNRISGVDKEVFLNLAATNLNLRLEFNLIESLPEDIFDDHTFDMINMQDNPFKSFSDKFCENNCRIYNFFFDCKHFDESTLHLIVNWAFTTDIGFYCENILDRNSTVVKEFQVRQDFCRSGAARNYHDLRNGLKNFLLAASTIYVHLKSDFIFLM